MDQEPLLVRKVGELRIRVWRLLKVGIHKQLGRDAECMAPEVVFRHRNGPCGRCNCSGVICEVAHKHGSAAMARGKLLIPLTMLHCDLHTSEAFIAEIRPLRFDYQPCHSASHNQTCLSSSKSRKRSQIDDSCKENNHEIERYKKNNHEIERIKRSYERIIKDLIKSVSCEKLDRDCKDTLDKRSIIELCLQNNVSSEKIVSLLKELEYNNELECNEEFEISVSSKKENIPNICDNCLESDQSEQMIPDPCRNESRDSSVSYCPSRIRTKNFKIVPANPSRNLRSCTNEVVNDCSRPTSQCMPHMDRSIPMYKTVRANNCRNQLPEFNQDLKEIKLILNDIVTVMSCKETCDDKPHRKKMICQENKSLKTEEILNLIMQHVSQCKCDPSDKCDDYQNRNRQIDDECVSGASSYSEDYQEKYIPIIETGRNHRYQNKPLKVPFMGNMQRPVDQFLHCDTESQQHRMGPAIQMKETPAALAEYLKTLPPPDCHNGVTHIHYYINNDTGSITTPTSGSHKEDDILCNKDAEKERQREIQCKDNFSKGYSHIVIDINSQQQEQQQKQHSVNIEPKQKVSVTDDKVMEAVTEQLTKVILSIKDDLNTKDDRHSGKSQI